jgi:hypothetical protein
LIFNFIFGLTLFIILYYFCYAPETKGTKGPGCESGGEEEDIQREKILKVTF